jgi:hypothetical protein
MNSEVSALASTNPRESRYVVNRLYQVWAPALIYTRTYAGGRPSRGELDQRTVTPRVSKPHDYVNHMFMRL